MFFIRSRKWVAFSSGLISGIKQKAVCWRCVFSGCQLISAAIFMIKFYKWALVCPTGRMLDTTIHYFAITQAFCCKKGIF